MTAQGVVNAQLEAVVRVRVRRPGKAAVEIDAVIDTGYSGTFILPAAVAMRIGLARRSAGRAMLADGSYRRFDTFTAEVEWGGEWRKLQASALGDVPLVGMGLMSGHELRVAVVVGGAVTVEALPVADA